MTMKMPLWCFVGILCSDIAWACRRHVSLFLSFYWTSHHVIALVISHVMSSHHIILLCLVYEKRNELCQSLLKNPCTHPPAGKGRQRFTVHDLSVDRPLIPKGMSPLMPRSNYWDVAHEALRSHGRVKPAVTVIKSYRNNKKSKHGIQVVLPHSENGNAHMH